MELARLADARRSGVTVSSFNTQYTGLRTSMDEVGADDDSRPLNLKRPDTNVRSSMKSIPPHELPNRSWFTTVLTTLFSLLWLAPMVTLLVLNLKQQVIGASAWCPFGHCAADSYSSDTAYVLERLHKLDERNHNLIGALQLVAKALEVWFIFIVGLFVYLLTMMIAEGRAGIPVAYLMRPAEFAELPSLFDPFFWRTLPPLSRRNPNHGALGARTRIWIFIFVTVFLAILCNLMGPAAAVLVIPSLQWIDAAPIGKDVFGFLAAAQPPIENGFVYNYTSCTSDDFKASTFACTQSEWAVDLDGAIQSYLVARGSLNAINQQDGFSFAFNGTDASASSLGANTIWWSPNRQMITNFYTDYAALTNISLGVQWSAANNSLDQASYDQYLSYNNSLSINIVRNGPIIGSIANTWLGYNDHSYSETIVANDRRVRCYGNYNMSYTPFFWGPQYQNYTRCVKFGDGWNTKDDQSCAFRNFTVDGIYRKWQKREGPDLYIETWSSGLNGTAFLPNGTLPQSFDPRCLASGRIQNGVQCDWDKFFAANTSSEVYNRTLYSNTVQIVGNYAPAANHPNKTSLVVDFNAFRNFTDYIWDPSSLSNPLSSIQNPNLPARGDPLPVNPDWTLAAWSVNNNDSIGANRTATLQLLQLVDAFWDSDFFTSADPLAYYYTDDTDQDLELDVVTMVPILQTLSLMEYYTNATLAPSVGKTLPADSPKLTQSARLNVWTYGMYSRTAYFGVGVTVLGCIVVLLQVILGLLDRREFLSPTRLLVAALEHTPQAEFAEQQHDELATAKVRFRVRHVHETAGKLAFARAL